MYRRKMQCLAMGDTCAILSASGVWRGRFDMHTVSLDIRKNLFTESGDALEQATREMVELLSLEAFKNYGDERTW